MYLITRPLAKLAQTDKAFAEAGLSACVTALQRTVELDSGISQMQQWLTAHPRATVIITSTAAADPFITHALLLINGHALIAVGQSTASVLRHAGLNPVVPAQETSEGVLALPLLNDCADQHILLLKGKGGRNTIPEHLTQKGATLSIVALYERERLTPPVLSRPFDWTHASGIVATSGEQAEALINEYNTQPLAALNWLTVSERIAHMLQQQGIRQIQVCPKATNEALIAWIQQNWE